MQIPFEYAELLYADRYAIKLHPRYADFYQRVLFPPTIRPECHGNPSSAVNPRHYHHLYPYLTFCSYTATKKKIQVSQCLPFVQHAQGCKGEYKYSPHQANTPT